MEKILRELANYSGDQRKARDSICAFSNYAILNLKDELQLAAFKVCHSCCEFLDKMEKNDGDSGS